MTASCDLGDTVPRKLTWDSLIRPYNVRVISRLARLTIFAAFAAGMTAPAWANDLPAWTADARWYYVVVPRFHNGDTANDPNDTLPWTADWLAGLDQSKPINVKTLAARNYGGDIQGLEQRLPYLKKLGVNTLCLASCLMGTTEGRSTNVDVRHIDPRVAVKGGYSDTDKETFDPATWVFSKSDRVFLDFVKAAHGQGFRVVLTGFFGAFTDDDSKISKNESYGAAALRRWIDPDDDGDPTDGIDGVMHGMDEGAFIKLAETEKSAWIRVREAAKTWNPNFVFLGRPTDAAGQSTDGMYDFSLDSAVSQSIEKFFHPSSSGVGAGEFLAELDKLFAARRERSQDAAPVVMSLLHAGRLLTRFSDPQVSAERPSHSPGPTPTPAAIDRWRLATIVHHLGGSPPMTFQGDEVGMFGGIGAFARAPMWWDDAPLPATKPASYRDDFFALTEWLHGLRAKYVALRIGVFRPVFHDNAKKLLAFARTLPGDEVIVVLNYGETKQEAVLPAGKPSQLIALMSPQVRPPAKRLPMQPKDPKKLPVGGSRQFVNADGQVSLWIDPMSARIIFVNDIEPRRP